MIQHTLKLVNHLLPHTHPLGEQQTGEDSWLHGGDGGRAGKQKKAKTALQDEPARAEPCG